MLFTIRKISLQCPAHVKSQVADTKIQKQKMDLLLEPEGKSRGRAGDKRRDFSILSRCTWSCTYCQVSGLDFDLGSKGVIEACSTMES